MGRGEKHLTRLALEYLAEDNNLTRLQFKILLAIVMNPGQDLEFHRTKFGVNPTSFHVYTTAIKAKLSFSSIKSVRVPKTHLWTYWPNAGLETEIANRIKEIKNDLGLNNPG